MTTIRAKFYVGQLVYHKRFDYRGVVVDVDPQFQGDDEWYEVMACSRPPKDKPWYHVLVHNADGRSRSALYRADMAMGNPAQWSFHALRAHPGLGSAHLAGFVGMA